jgi:hypothetical protein
MDVSLTMGDLTDAPPVPPSPRAYKKVQLVCLALNKALCIICIKFIKQNLACKYHVGPLSVFCVMRCSEKINTNFDFK